MSFKKDGRRNLEIDYFYKSITIMVRLAIAALVNSVFIKTQAKIAAGAR